MEGNIIGRSSDREDSDWRLRANCRGEDPDLFFPPTHHRKDERLEQERLAKTVCDACSVENDCLEFALVKNEESGVWGGKSADERRKLRKTYLKMGRIARH